jgi:hypothetical protein
MLAALDLETLLLRRLHQKAYQQQRGFHKWLKN